MKLDINLNPFLTSVEYNEEQRILVNELYATTFLKMNSIKIWG